MIITKIRKRRATEWEAVSVGNGRLTTSTSDAARQIEYASLRLV